MFKAGEILETNRHAVPVYRVIVAFVAVATIYGLVANGLYADVPAPAWQPLAWLLLAAAVAVALAAVTSPTRAGPRACAALALLLVGSCLTYIGLTQMAVALTMGATAVMSGDVLMRARASASDTAVTATAGLVVMGALVGWILPFPVHRTALYAAVLLVVAIVWCRLPDAGARRVGGQLTAVVARAPWPMVFVLVMLLLASTGLWLPSVGYDDNVVHQMLPAQLLRDGYYHLDFSTQLWALSPWLMNALQGAAAVISGEVGRAGINLVWLLLGGASAYALASRLGAGNAGSLLAAGLWYSQPLVAYFNSVMQADMASAVVLMSLSAALAQAHERRAPVGIAAGVLAGGLIALKASNALYVLPFVGWMAWYELRAGRWLGLIASGLAALAVAASSYVYAYWLTGNPMFPMYNTLFKSPYFPAQDFVDSRWLTGVGPDAPWSLMFETTRYFESSAGAAGVTLLLVLALALLAVTRPGATRWIAIGALAGGIATFWQIQYLRYLFPAISVLTVVGVVALREVTPVGRRLATLVIVVFAALNVPLIQSTSWFMRSGALSTIASGLGSVASRDQVTRSLVPQRALLERLEALRPAACVLVDAPVEAYFAPLAGDAVGTLWYDPQVSNAALWAEQGADDARWDAVLGSMGVTHVVMNAAPGQDRARLTALLRARGAAAIAREGPWVVWELNVPGGSRCTSTFFSARDSAAARFGWGR